MVMPVETPTRTAPDIAPDVEVDPDRRLNPDRLCPAQKETITREI